MRFYRNRNILKISGEDIFKAAAFIILLVVGLKLCPKGSLYTVGEIGVRQYVLGIFLISMSVVYFFTSLVLHMNFKPAALRAICAVLIIGCGIASIELLSGGGLKLPIGISTILGVLTGALIAIII
jgi:hypothetical protein